MTVPVQVNGRVRGRIELPADPAEYGEEETRAAALAARALEFFRSGELGWVYCHLMSIGTLYQFDAVAKVEGDPDEAEGGQEKTHAKPKRKRGLRSNLQ